MSTPRSKRKHAEEGAESDLNESEAAAEGAVALGANADQGDRSKGKEVSRDEAGMDGQTSPEEEERARIWDVFAEEYHDIVTELPLEYHRNFTLLTELEETQQNATSALKSSLQSYLTSSTTVPNTVASPTASTSAPSYVEDEESITPLMRATLAEIATCSRNAIRAGEDKVGLAVTLYEAVDRHIRRLDSDLAKYEDSLIIGLREGTLPSHDAPSLSLKSPPGRTTSLGAIALGEREAYGENEENTSRRRGVKMGAAADHAEKEKKRIAAERRREKKLAEEREMGMPVDPNEPTYCYCDRVSFGEMIGCDNEDCAREWASAFTRLFLETHPYFH